MTGETTRSSRWKRPLCRVVSGGQTGAEQAALFAAKACGIPTAGWAPEGWQTAAGPNPRLLADRFGLHEQRGGHAQSLRTNILDADGTLWLAYEFTGPDEQLCRRTLESCGAEFLDLRLPNLPPVHEVVEWIVDKGIRTLHITGARERYRPPYVLPTCLPFLVNLFACLEYRADPSALAAFGLSSL
jgi:hypothetical protein